MDVDRVSLTPSERAEHMRNKKCFICHKEGCHSSQHKGYLGKREGGPFWGRTPPKEGSWRKKPVVQEVTQEDLQVSTFMKQHDISPAQAIEMMGNYYDQSAKDWNPVSEEEVDLISLDF